MNYDGQAIVVSDKKNMVRSVNGDIYVNLIPNVKNSDRTFRTFLSETDLEHQAIAFNKTALSCKDVVIDKNIYEIKSTGETNVTTNVMFITSSEKFDNTKKDITFNTLYQNVYDTEASKNILFDTKYCTSIKQKGILCDNVQFDNVFADCSHIVRTNMYEYNDYMMYMIIDKTKAVSSDSTSKDFIPVYVEVTDKTEVTIPDVNDMQNFSVVVQKNSFIEIKLSSEPNNILGLPPELDWKSNTIKGTLLESKEYQLTVYYETGEQNITIVVPYYQRLL